MVTDRAGLMWLRNFRELEGLVTWWIVRLQPFDFAIVHHPGKHHSRADGLPWRTSRPCKRKTCPKCKPLRKAAVPKTKTALCYTPALPYQRHFDGYVKMSKDDASLFWEMDVDPAPDHKSDSADSTLPTRTAPIDEEVVHEEVISIAPVSTSKPDDSRRMDASATLMDESQDTKPVEPVHAVRSWGQTGAPAHNTLSPRPLCLQATIGTQINEMNQPSIETSLEDKTPSNPTDTTIPGPTQPKSIRTKCKGKRRADLETPNGPAPELEGDFKGSAGFR